jgi:nitrous oxidase accessory protein NosD
VDRHPEGTVFILASGVHMGQSVVAKSRNQFIGEPGAVLDGGGRANYAFAGRGNGVLIQGLVIQNYAANVTEGVIRAANGSSGWTIQGNEIRNNGGMGIKLGSGWRIIENNIHHNQQYAIGGGGSDILVEGNELAYNNPNMQVNPYHGAGGTKFLSSNNLVIRNNYSHHNNGPGLWADGDNINVVYEGNRVEANLHAGIKHEISCRATIRNNVVVGNGFGNDNWLAGAGIVVLNSPDVTITGNTVTNNEDGIGGIQGTRDTYQGANCRRELRNLTVSGNSISMQTGFTGIVTNHTSDVYRWNNVFSGNSYTLGNQGEYFRWDGGNYTLQQWQQMGMG